MQNIRIELQKEVLARSASATVAFTAVAAMVFFSNLFAAELSMPVKAFSLAIIAANAVRLLAYVNWRRTNEADGLNWLSFYGASVANALLWGLCLALTANEAMNTPWTVTVTILISVGFSIASVFTLGNSASLQLFFVMLVMLPLMGVFVQWHNKSNDSFYLSMCVFMAIALVYTLSQSRASRNRFIAKLKADADLRKSQAELLEQRAMTEHANRLTAIGELAAGFAHEINNPLAIVTGNLQLLQTQIVKQHGSIDPQSEKLIQRAVSASGRISKIIKGLRTLSRRSSMDGKAPHHLSMVLQETLLMYEERLYRSDVKVTSNFAYDPEVMCDSVQISQIFLNLLNNACDVLQEEGNKEERWVKVESKALADKSILIEVTNGGKPIPEELAKKLFSPFFTTKPVGQGMGLGLSISRSIAIQHEGNLELTTATGHTSFRLTLPVTPASQT